MRPRASGPYIVQMLSMVDRPSGPLTRSRYAGGLKRIESKYTWALYANSLLTLSRVYRCALYRRRACLRLRLSTTVLLCLQTCLLHGLCG